MTTEVATPATVAPATAPAPKAPEAAPTCKANAAHGKHRRTTSGTYCYSCDRAIAEAENTARRAAKKANKDAADTRTAIREAAKKARKSLAKAPFVPDPKA